MRQESVARLRRFASRVASAASVDEVVRDIAAFAAETSKCEACGVYVAEGENLVSQQTQQDHLKRSRLVGIQTVVGATGWELGSRELVTVPHNAWTDPRVLLFFSEPPQDRFDWFLSIPMVNGGRLAGAINLTGRDGQAPDEPSVELIATMGLLAGAEIERLRLASENKELSEKLEARKIVERAKGILQRNLTLSEEDAYLMLQRESRQRRMSMKEVAEAIVLSEDLKKK